MCPPWINSCKPVTSTEPSQSCMIMSHTNGFAGRSANLHTWLGRLSEEDLRAHRGRMLDYSIALGLAGRVEEEGWWLAQAASAAGDPDADFDVRLAAANAQWHAMRGEPDPALEFERDVFSHLAPGTDFVLDQFPIISTRARLYRIGPVSCIAACDLALGHADPSTRAVLLGIRSGALFELGELRESREAANAALEAARRRGVEHHVGLCDAVLTLGTLSLEAGQLDDAEGLIEEAVRRCEKIRPPLELLALVERARLFRARGELVEGLGILERARTVLPAGASSPLHLRVDALEARIRIDLDEPERAADLGRTLPRLPTCGPPRSAYVDCIWGKRIERMSPLPVWTSATLACARRSSTTSSEPTCGGTWGSLSTTISGEQLRSDVCRASFFPYWTRRLPA